MKYRVKQTIKETGSEFIPQRKFFLFWIDIQEKVKYDTLEDALKFIAYYNLKRLKKDVVYHDVTNTELL
jgi:hypothetical protein